MSRKTTNSNSRNGHANGYNRLEDILNAKNTSLTGAVVKAAKLTPAEIASPLKKTVSSKSTNQTGSSLQKSKPALAFAALLGCGLKIDVGRRLSFFANTDYFISSPTYKDVETVAFDGNITKRTFQQEIGAFNFSGGLGIRF